MFIVLGPLHRASPFGGAETEFKIIIQDRFRSSERRRRELACWAINMAHLGITGRKVNCS
jgi:hypothetical protein